MDVILCVTNTEEEHLIKSLYSITSFTGTLRNESSVIEPTIFLEVDNPSSFNYAYIGDFGRYYYIKDMVMKRKNLWEIHMKCDVLMSFANYIKASVGIISEQATKEDQFSPYLDNDVWVSTVRNKTDVYPFSGGFNDTPNFILITAGG